SGEKGYEERQGEAAREVAGHGSGGGMSSYRRARSAAWRRIGSPRVAVCLLVTHDACQHARTALEGRWGSVVRTASPREWYTIVTCAPPQRDAFQPQPPADPLRPRPARALPGRGQRDLLHDVRGLPRAADAG